MPVRSPPDQSAFSWYPPHMHRAQKRLLKEVETADLVLEMRDARLPAGSANPELERIVSHRRRLVLLNKAALADPQASAAWRDALTARGHECLVLDAETARGLAQVRKAADRASRAMAEPFRRRGIRPPQPRLMVIGIPNVGKSTLINRWIHRKRLATGPQPGVTRASQWVALKGRYLLLDSPGVLLPRIAGEADALPLGWIGALPDRLLGAERLATELIRWLLQHRPHGLVRAYFGEDPAPEEAEDWLPALADRYRWFLPGPAPDHQRAAEHLLRAFRRGALGRVTFERPHPRA